MTRSFTYRTFYTWDHSTNWDLSQPGARVSGCHEAYEKPAGAFVQDYARLIEAMSELGLNHLIIWGALRDSHGGVEALREVVERGRRAGVRVAPGIGVNCYGGVYYEGNQEFSLVHLLQTNPDLAAVDKTGRRLIDERNPRRSVACPRNPKIIDWTLRSMRWLMEEVGPLAIHFETGDYGVCHCETCRRTGDRSLRTSDEDMADVMPPIVAEVRRHSADCWLSYNHYTGYTRAMSAEPPRFTRAIAPDVICKWGVSWMLEPSIFPGREGFDPPEPWDPAVRPPTATSMAHLHYGTGWWNCSPRGTLEISRFFAHVPKVAAVGFQGLCTHGEDSNMRPSSELNYHVFSALAENPKATPEEIAARSVGGILGSEDLAASVLTAFAVGRVPRDLAPAVGRAATTASGQLRARLCWLVFALHELADAEHRQRSGGH